LEHDTALVVGVRGRARYAQALVQKKTSDAIVVSRVFQGWSQGWLLQ
jgi:hypothetical protein